MRTERKIMIIPDWMIGIKAFESGEEKTLTNLHHDTKITYSHWSNMRTMFKEKGWIVGRVEGRSIYYMITEKGKEMVKVINNLLHLIEIKDEDILGFRKNTKSGGRKPKEEAVKLAFHGIKMEEKENDNQSNQGI